MNTKLTEAGVRNLVWSGKDYRVGAGVPGLQLQVRKRSKTWLVRRQQAGKLRIHTLGRWPDINVKEAVRRASEIAAEGTGTGGTVEALVEAYHSKIIQVNHRRPELANTHWKQLVVPTWGSRQADSLRTDEIATAVQQYAVDRGARSASVALQLVNQLLAYGQTLGWIRHNPCTPIRSGHVTGYSYQPRTRVLTMEEIQHLWKSKHYHARTLRFILATGLRPGEIRKGYRDGKYWRIDADVQKSGKDHWVYLSGVALENLPEKVTTLGSLQKWCRTFQNNVADPYRPHDLRRSAATLMAEAGVTPFIVERVLAHSLTGMMKVYNQADYRKERIMAAKQLETAIDDALLYER